MDLELVTIGTELLLGFTVDSNTALMGQLLAGAGIRISRSTSVGDDPELVAGAVGEALRRNRLVITSGGLGPTSDDLTRQAVAALFGLPLEFHQEIWDQLTARFARMGRTLAEKNRCQAEVPRGATVLPNPRGTAPGLWISGDLGEVILLPGPPRELRGLMVEEVLPRLTSRGESSVIRSLVVRTTGIAESAVAERLEPAEAELPPLTLAFLAGLEGVDLRITSWNLPASEAARQLETAADRIRGLLGAHVYGTDEDDLAEAFLAECRDRSLTLAVAESCTGGGIGARITSVPGSSDVFVGGLIAYANRLKHTLGVSSRILEGHGAVSEETVLVMARAAREHYGVDLGLAVTGIAGPGGGSAEKPVGLVWLAIADAKGVETHRWVFPGSRQEIRARAAQFALWKLWLRVRSGGPVSRLPD